MAIDTKEAILSWKCIDSFDDAYPDKICWTGSFDISKRQAVILRDIFASMKEKWTREINRVFLEDEECFEVTGGNYTFFFVLPALLAQFQKDHPFLSIDLSLLETYSIDNLVKYSPDIILGASYENVDFPVKDLINSGYTFARKSYFDAIYFAASKDVAKKFASKKDILKKHDLVFGRIYERYSTKKIRKNLPYNLVPQDRQNEEPRVSIDFYFMGYDFMTRALGIWHVFASDTEISKFLILSIDDVVRMRRFLIFKQDVRSSYKHSMSIALRRRMA